MSLEQVDALRAMLMARRALPPPTIAERRAGFEAQMAARPLPADAEFTPADGVPALWIDRPDGVQDKVVLWLHGGAFVLGSSVSYRDFGCRLAAASGCRVLLLDYALAPEHRFPRPGKDVLAALEWLDSQGVVTAIGGDSAGGNLAAAAVQSRLNDRRSVPKACILLSPYLDLTHTGASIAPRARRDPFVDPATMAETAATYHGDADPRDPRVSPLFGSVAGFPPTLVQVGSDEVLFDDARRFADELPDAVFQEWVGMIHVWPLFAGQIDEGDWAIAQMGSFLRRHLFQA